MMRTIITLGVCVIYNFLVALTIAERANSFETPTKENLPVIIGKNEAKSELSPSYGASRNNPESTMEYEFHQQQRLHDKRATDLQSLPSALETLPPEVVQQHLRDRRQPWYVDEPGYILLRRPLLQQSSSSAFSFIPQRGRKSGPLSSDAASPALAKRELSIKQMLEGGDYFVPNRGKKRFSNGISKKVKFDEILGSDELFIPNRGKKELLDLLVPSSSQFSGRLINDFRQPLIVGSNSKKNILNAIQTGGHKDISTGEELFYPTRGKKNILDNLAQSQETFFSSRGKRNPTIWNLLSEEKNPWDFLDTGGDYENYESDNFYDRFQSNKLLL
ncbi:uncharacterized protein LOC129759346 [Uranotaenia lowii]|uniref:uncharacterized protein LOC129759346 n=1 Tax=Uranotaenia lowii TaxID=190385 RepID=UPI002479D44A|nr:uncharacterized protein LOC129759346 [Uranotaenia lowii]